MLLCIRVAWNFSGFKLENINSLEQNLYRAVCALLFVVGIFGVLFYLVVFSLLVFLILTHSLPSQLEFMLGIASNCMGSRSECNILCLDTPGFQRDGFKCAF